VAIGLLSLASTAAAQPSHARMEALLDALVGSWEMRGHVQGDSVTYDLQARRVLQGRFVELHMEDVNRPPGYEARVFIGVDSVGQRYIAHWLDAFGAAYSIPHAVGGARGDTLLLTFAYSSGPFHDIFIYDRGQDLWRFRIESADSAGKRSLFAEYVGRRKP
jgi:hypothetical protein